MTSPTKFSSQKTDASQDCSCMSKNMTKWRISAHEGSRKPHELGKKGEGGKSEKGGEEKWQGERRKMKI